MAVQNRDAVGSSLLVKETYGMSLPNEVGPSVHDLKYVREEKCSEVMTNICQFVYLFIYLLIYASIYDSVSICTI
jgi:hypothetical protein